jgi:hypothetical protein
MYGQPVDIEAFLQRPLLARVATNGPTVRPVWFLYEDGAFWWLTDTRNVLHKVVERSEQIVLIVDECNIETGEVIHVRARDTANIVAVDRERALRKFERYLGPDRSAWDPRFVPSLDLPSTRMCRLAPATMEAADVSFQVLRGRT